MKSKLVTPHAAIVVWNYNDRDSADGTLPSLNQKIEQVIIGTSSVISISTVKRKSSPAGSFEVKLAPRFNWVSRITPGSWCAILMSQDPISSISNQNPGTAKKESFKMLGRIDSIRGVVEVNQENGARSTAFIMTGQDWGSVFETSLYIDQSIAENILSGNSIAQSYTILGLNMYKTYGENKALPTSSDTVDTMLNLWGSGTGVAISNGEELVISASTPQINSLLLSAGTQFQLPTEVAKFMKQGKTVLGQPIPGTTSVNFSEIIHRQHGKLEKEDKSTSAVNYKRIDEARGIPNPSQFMGKHSLWQLLTDLSNNALYELVNDVRWVNDQPNFTLYHRIRPFVTRSNFIPLLKSTPPEPLAASAVPTVTELQSLFKHVRKVEIPLDDVVNINFGTNWRDKINFIEIRPNFQLVPEAQSLLAKINGQTLDAAGYQRDGFKPMFVECPFVPCDGDQGSGVNIEKLSHWKYILREWYFNTHMMLNGSLTFIGQNNYIQVGDNILVDSTVLGRGYINSAQLAAVGQKVYLLAHVENIMHNFSVNQETGARTFSTTVQFVRGIMSDKSGNTIALGYPVKAIEPGAIDSYASAAKTDRNDNTFGSSTINDPDAQKIKGS